MNKYLTNHYDIRNNIFRRWKNYINYKNTEYMRMEEQLNPLINIGIYLDIDTRVSINPYDNKFKCYKCDDIVKNEYIKKDNKLYLHRRTYCNNCFIHSKEL